MTSCASSTHSNSADTTDANILDIAVIGGGIAGCSAARHLLAQGRRLVLFDRGRHAGGRASSNRQGFDYGVAAFEATDADFLMRVNQWHEAGQVGRWQPRARRWIPARESVEEFPTADVDEQWIGTDSFASILAAELDQVVCQQETIVQRVEFDDGVWSVIDVHGQVVGQARELLLAMPVEQARRLLAAPLQKALLPVERPTQPMSVPQWVAMLEFEAPVSPTTDLILFDEHPALAAAWSEARKPGGSDTKWVIHSKPTWAQTRLSIERETIAEQMFAAFKQAIGRCPLVMSHRAHRWTFSRSRQGLTNGPLRHENPPVTLCGDWSVDGSFQGAWLSGRAAVDLLGTKP